MRLFESGEALALFLSDLLSDIFRMRDLGLEFGLELGLELGVEEEGLVVVTGLPLV